MMRIVTGRRNKYRNKKTVIDNITFDSRKEALRYKDLNMLSRAGIISDLELQPKFEIIPAINWNGKRLQARYYIADFRYKQNGITIVEDVKGMKTSVYTLKRQLFLIRYPGYRFIET
jgi:hypothetical protein